MGPTIRSRRGRESTPPTGPFPEPALPCSHCPAPCAFVLRLRTAFPLRARMDAFWFHTGHVTHRRRPTPEPTGRAFIEAELRGSTAKPSFLTLFPRFLNYSVFSSSEITATFRRLPLHARSGARITSPSHQTEQQEDRAWLTRSWSPAGAPPSLPRVTAVLVPFPPLPLPLAPSPVISCTPWQPEPSLSLRAAHWLRMTFWTSATPQPRWPP